MLKLSEIIISGIKSFDTLSTSACLSTFPPWTCSNGYADIIFINCSSKTTGLTGVFFVAVFFATFSAVSVRFFFKFKSVTFYLKKL